MEFQAKLCVLRVVRTGIINALLQNSFYSYLELMSDLDTFLPNIDAATSVESWGFHLARAIGYSEYDSCTKWMMKVMGGGNDVFARMEAFPDAARQVLIYFISQEEKYYDQMLTSIKKYTERNLISQTNINKAFKILPSKIELFGRNNLGMNCWYYTKLWEMLPYVTTQKQKFFDSLSCQEAEVVKFMEWVMGTDYSFQDLLKEYTTMSFQPLLPDLLAIVHHFLAAPCPKTVKQRILSLI